MKELNILQMEEVIGGITQQEYMCGLAGAIFTWGWIAVAILPPAGAVALSVGAHMAIACL